MAETGTGTNGALPPRSAPISSGEAFSAIGIVVGAGIVGALPSLVAQRTLPDVSEAGEVIFQGFGVGLMFLSLFPLLDGWRRRDGYGKMSFARWLTAGTGASPTFVVFRLVMGW